MGNPWQGNQQAPKQWDSLQPEAGAELAPAILSLPWGIGKPNHNFSKSSCCWFLLYGQDWALLPGCQGNADGSRRASPQDQIWAAPVGSLLLTSLVTKQCGCALPGAWGLSLRQVCVCVCCCHLCGVREVSKVLLSSKQKHTGWWFIEGVCKD